MSYTVSGTYGSNNTPCRIYVVENSDGSRWYAVHDSENINCTWDQINAGVNVETLNDFDTRSENHGITSEAELLNAIGNDDDDDGDDEDYYPEDDPEKRFWDNVATWNERHSYDDRD